MSAGTLTLAIVIVALVILGAALGAALLVAFLPLLGQVNDAVSALAR